MRTIVSILLGAIFLSFSGYGQISLDANVLASGGAYGESETMSISWTLGELATTTLRGGDMILTQGFQQPLDIGTGINTKEVNWGISAYPNPVTDVLFVQFNTNKNREFWIEVQDVTGRVLSLERHNEIFPGDVVRLNTSSFAYGVYFLKVFTPDREETQVLSIRKL